MTAVGVALCVYAALLLAGGRSPTEPSVTRLVWER